MTSRRRPAWRGCSSRPSPCAGSPRCSRRPARRSTPAQLHKDTAGNPFYVTEVLAAGDDSVPATVRDAVLARAVAPVRAGTARARRGGGARPARRAAAARRGLRAGSGARWTSACSAGVLVGDGDVAGPSGTSWRGWRSSRPSRPRCGPTCTPRHSSRSGHPARTTTAASPTTPPTAGDRVAVLHHARRAAVRAARLGAHREAAEQYRLALRFHDRSDDVRAELCSTLSYECYLTDQLDDALASRLEALELYAQAGDALAVGTAQRWLSRLSWFLGRNDDSRAVCDPCRRHAGAARRRAGAGDGLQQRGPVAHARRRRRRNASTGVSVRPRSPGGSATARRRSTR